MGEFPRSRRSEGGHRDGPPRRRLIALGAAAIAIAGGGIGIAALLSSGGADRPPRVPTALPGTIPARNVPASPPWGLSGSGWSDFCYQQTETPPGFAQQQVSDGQPCPEGTVRFTGTSQIASTARAGA